MAELKINGDRLWASLMEMAKIGATPKGGVCRLTLTDLDKQGRDLFVQWCKDAGCSVKVDQMGNIFARRPGRNNSLAPVGTGSHLDSQPTGGRFDGVYGVLAGLEVIRTLNDLGIETERPVEASVWTNEEGSRFAPAMVGSGRLRGRVLARVRPLAHRPAGQDDRRGAEAHRLPRQRTDGQPAGACVLRDAHRAGPDPRGRRADHRRRHRRAGPALVRAGADRPGVARRPDADAGAARRAARRGQGDPARQRDRPEACAAGRLDGRHDQQLPELAQRDPGQGLPDRRLPLPGQRRADADGRRAERGRREDRCGEAGSSTT